MCFYFHTVGVRCLSMQLKRWLSSNLKRDWGPWTHPLVVMGTRPCWRRGLRFIFLVWSVGATVPLIRMLTWPAILCDKTAGTVRADTFIISVLTTAIITLTYDLGTLTGMCVCWMPHSGGRGCRCVRRLDFQWMLLQVLFDDLQIHLRAGRRRHSTPGPPSTQPDLINECYLTNTERGDFQQSDFSVCCLMLAARNIM